MKNRRKVRSVGLVLLPAIAAGAGLALLIKVGDATYGQTARALRGETRAHLADSASEAGAQLEQLLVSRLADVEALAGSPAAERLAPHAILRSMGTADRLEGGSYSSMVVVDAHGRPVVELPPGARAGAPVAGFGRKPLLAGRRLASILASPQAIEIGPNSPLAARTAPGRPDVVLSTPIRRADGRLVGAWLDVVSPEAIDGAIAAALRTRNPPDVQLYVVDRRRRVVASDGPGTAPVVTADGGASSTGTIVSTRSTEQAQPADLFRASARGDELIAGAPTFAHSVLSQLGWSVVATEHRTTALAPARRVHREGWLIVLTAALIVLTAALVVLAAGAVVARALRRSSTQRERLDQSLRQSHKLEAVGRLAGSIAHDFNNALTVIAGNAQLALGTEPDGEIETNLREIVYSSERASDLVRRLLAFSRPGEHKAATVDVNDGIRGLVRLLPRLIEANIDVSAELTPEPTFVLLDPTRLEQVLLNLTFNAREAMPHGGTLAFGTEVDGSVVRLRVADDGAGMDAHTRERIFDPFFTTKPDGKGTGLGLATVYGIVTQAGGSIGVESAPGRGTAFTVELPLAPPDSLPSASPHGADAATGSGERVLVLDDDEMVRVVAGEMLTRAGYDVTVAGDGAAALELFDRGERFDLVVSDIVMPRMTGLELADALHARGDETPIVFMSGYSAEAVGADGPTLLQPTITKPFSQGEIADAAGRLLAHTGTAPGPASSQSPR